MALTDNLVAYWKLDEASGTRVDATGRGNDLAEVGTPGSVTGKLGNAVDTSSGNGLNKASAADLIVGGGDYTLAAWISFDAVGSSGSDIVNKWATVGGFEYSLAKASGVSDFRFFGGTGVFESVDAGITLGTGTWYYVVCWRDTGAATISIQVNDGTPASTGATAGGTTGTSDFVIGQSAFGDPHDGRIDEVGLWKRVLTAQERTDLYNGGAGLAYPFGAGGIVRQIMQLYYYGGG